MREKSIKHEITDYRGSTKTTIVLMSEDGAVVAEDSGPPTNQWVGDVLSYPCKLDNIRPAQICQYMFDGQVL